MGNPFKTPKAPDTSKQDAALDRQEAEAKANKTETMKMLAARRRSRLSGKKSLLSGDETGTRPPLKETLG